ncbi:Ceramide glucosyltransferase [Escovopsis weberi]|uniref:Ceramide glucosyltransferase n=1 Tax=Escovopsis weberi TaxID=150374 RepID=A0A0M9VRY0_ESCWE|nr:Ceramide glucosyltransferase [Escovopsis weberi]
MTQFVELAAAVSLAWAVLVLFVQAVGIGAIYRHFSRTPRPPHSSNLGRDAPAVTIIRPVKGLEPKLYECIASTFRQAYPRDKVSIRLCVQNEADPAYPVLQRLIRDFPSHDAQILLEDNDPASYHAALGPNPKIRNISRAYREAKGDIIWVIDCNVWVSSGVLGRMVDRLMGFTAPGEAPEKPFKFVHQMPLVVDLEHFSRAAASAASHESQALLSDGEATVARAALHHGGGRLDEMFMATSHVKFYCAINVVSVAPCIVGKSNMFRKSHLDQVTDPARNPILPQQDDGPRPGPGFSPTSTGVDYFSHNICEDHLIGDILWRSDIPGFANHGIVWGDLALQPMAGMSLANYAARRVRWLRARKFTVLLATLVEPGIEAFLCSGYLSFSITTLPYFRDTFGVAQSWASMGLGWLLSVMAWMLVDWVLFRFLHSGLTVEVDPDTPAFARGTLDKLGMPRRSLAEWIPAWLGRELLALPIWFWAVLLGTRINWRGKEFKVRLDTTVEELTGGIAGLGAERTPELERAKASSKDRQD